MKGISHLRENEDEMENTKLTFFKIEQGIKAKH